MENTVAGQTLNMLDYQILKNIVILSFLNVRLIEIFGTASLFFSIYQNYTRLSR